MEEGIPDNIDKLANEVAENISLQAMSRMCRKGMFRRSDDDRLRDAETIDRDEELCLAFGGCTR